MTFHRLIIGKQGGSTAKSSARTAYSQFIVFALTLFFYNPGIALGSFSLTRISVCSSATSSVVRCADSELRQINIFDPKGVDPRQSVDFNRNPSLRPVGRIDGSTVFLVSPCYVLA